MSAIEAPVKVAVISEGSRYIAFVTTDFSSLCDAYHKDQAIVDALEAAGIIQVIDVNEERRKKREAERKAELARLASAEPVALPASIE